MEKHGFVYRWYDKGKDRYYIGCHWGKEDDGYICSSNWMRMSHKRRPWDFERTVLKTNISSKEELLNEEYKWLSSIKEEELGKQYYNLRNSKPSFGPDQHTKKSKEKSSISNKGKKRTEETKRKISESKTSENHPLFGKHHSELTKEKMRKPKPTRTFEHCKAISEANKGRSVWNKGLKNAQVAWNKGIPWSKEVKEKVSSTKKGKSPAWNKGIPCREKTKEKLKLKNSGKTEPLERVKRRAESIRKNWIINNPVPLDFDPTLLIEKLEEKYHVHGRVIKRWKDLTNKSKRLCCKIAGKALR